VKGSTKSLHFLA